MANPGKQLWDQGQIILTHNAGIHNRGSGEVTCMCTDEWMEKLGSWCIQRVEYLYEVLKVRSGVDYKWNIRNDMMHAMCKIGPENNILS